MLKLLTLRLMPRGLTRPQPRQVGAGGLGPGAGEVLPRAALSFIFSWMTLGNRSGRVEGYLHERMDALPCTHEHASEHPAATRQSSCTAACAPW